jgi:5-methylcytosine-specific restriction protein A
VGYTYYYNKRLIPMVKPVVHTRLRGRLGVAQRKRIRERDNYQCVKCRLAVAIGEVDHILSLEDGGTNDDRNMQLLCTKCHIRKTANDRGYKLTTGTSVDGTPTNPNHHWN